MDAFGLKTSSMISDDEVEVSGVSVKSLNSMRCLFSSGYDKSLVELILEAILKYFLIKS